ncbi:MAG TPA: hypothetical protein VLF39_04240 [Candidatus Saccharimonadales bacterium]|nr:hypothetical protein [Candidatus Saccharimonadales bacterium]
MRKFINLVIAFITATILLTPVVAMAASAAQQAVCNGAGLGTGCTAPAGSTNIPSAAAKSVQLFAVVIGFVAVVMVIISGFKYITSNGDPNAVASAKNTLIYAIVGIIVAALAQGIVKYVLNKIR